MAQEIEPVPKRLFDPTQYNPDADLSKAPQSKALGLLWSVVTFCSVVVAVMMVTTGVLWLANREPNPNASADAFLWIAGQNKTWDQYQKEQGRGPEDEKEIDWMQQLLTDAYSR